MVRGRDRRIARARERAIKSYKDMSVEELKERIKTVKARPGESRKELKKLTVEIEGRKK